MNRNERYSAEVREQAVRLVFEHESAYESRRAAIGSVASKIGCTAETLRIGCVEPSVIRVAETA